MVSHSDGETFHVLLADRPIPYPLERSAVPSKQLSGCFWYSHARRPMETLSTIIILEGSLTNKTALFHKIETVADVLAEELSAREQLAEVYELFEHSPAPWSTPEYTPLCNFPVPDEAR
jgi:hypothetical protein